MAAALARDGGVVIRVLMVSLEPGGRHNLERAITQDSGLLLVAASRSLQSLGDAARARRPDVILLDFGREPPRLPMVLEQRPAHGATPLVVLLDDLDRAAGARALRAGARAVLPRNAPLEQIRAAVRAAAAGLTSVPAALAALVDDASADGTHATIAAGPGPLTPREAEILTLLGDGLGNKQIGVRLGISEHTVKTHLAAIYEKLDVSNRAEAVATGLRLGLVML